MASTSSALDDRRESGGRGELLGLGWALIHPVSHAPSASYYPGLPRQEGRNVSAKNTLLSLRERYPKLGYLVGLSSRYLLMDLTIKGPKSSKRVGLGEIFRMNRGEIKYKGGEEGPILLTR